jgi:hypothetical protein
MKFNKPIFDGRRYVDRDGQLWERLNEDYVRRLSDGNIGLWDSGKRLTEIDRGNDGQLSIIATL